MKYEAADNNVEIRSSLKSRYVVYDANIKKQQNRYLRFPRTVSIETQVNCNAKCSFCPYPLSPRKGEQMSTELVEKIISEISAIPEDHLFSVMLSRINEPLLDKRIEYFHELLKENVPQAKVIFISNGTMIKKGRFEWMNNYNADRLTISLNSTNPDEHLKLMGISTKSVFKNLDYVHQIKAAGEFDLEVRLSILYSSESQASRDVLFCNERWPLFSTAVNPFFSWAGASESGSSEREKSAFSAVDEFPETAQFACGQWYDLHILSNGFATKCCIDEHGFQGDDAYDARNRNVLDIYAQSHSLRASLPPRGKVADCQGCAHLG